MRFHIASSVAVVYRDSLLFFAIAIESRSRWHEFWRKLRNCTSRTESSGQAYLARQWPFFSAFYSRDKNSFITLLLKSVNLLKRHYVDSADEKKKTEKSSFFAANTSRFAYGKILKIYILKYYGK